MARITVSYKPMDTARQHIYDKLEYTKIMAGRQDRSLLGKSFDYLEALEDRMDELGQDLRTLTREQQTLHLNSIFDEFNMHGTIATQEKYKMANHEKFAVTNIICQVAPLARKRIASYLHHCENKKSPYQSSNMASTRWLIGGKTLARGGQTAFWNNADVMTAEKQPYFIDRINLLHCTGAHSTGLAYDV